MSTYEEFWGTELLRGKTTWDEERTMLYAVAVGAGLDDNLRELQFTTENTPGMPLQALPTFVAQQQRGFGWVTVLGWGDSAMTIRAVHGEHAVTLERPLPATGTANTVTTLDGVFDKGSGALVVTTTHVTLETGEYIGSSRMSVFVQGKGGFGGPRNVPWPSGGAMPDRVPDSIVRLPVGLNQSLLFRLLGDRTPHGTTMEGALRDGFDRPIFFGLGTFGFAGRALLRAMCDGDVSRFGHLEGRFSKPVYPGDELETRIWHTDEGAVFQVVADRGERIAFDRGLFRYA